MVLDSVCIFQILLHCFVDKAGGGEGGKDPCHPNPCLNGGTCKQNGNGFDCLCEVQYTGSVCEGTCDAYSFYSVLHLKFLTLSYFQSVFTCMKFPCSRGKLNIMEVSEVIGLFCIILSSGTGVSSATFYEKDL